MDTQNELPSSDAEKTEGQDAGHTNDESATSGDRLVNELGRVGRKFVEVLEIAWNSDQRRQIERELRVGLNNVAGTLESGIQEVSEHEQTKEVMGKAGEVADEVVEKVRASEFANELAAGLASGLHALGDQLDQLAREIRSATPPTEDIVDSSGESSEDANQDIPISVEEPETSSKDV